LLVLGVQEGKKKKYFVGEFIIKALIINNNKDSKLFGYNQSDYK